VHLRCPARLKSVIKEFAVFRFLYAAVSIILFSTPVAGQAPLDYVQAGDFTGARTALAKLVAGDPTAPIHFAFLEAMILKREGKLDEAVALLRQILSVDPDFEPARRELAFTLADMGQVQGALYHAERLVATTPDVRLRADLQGFITSSGLGRPRGIAWRFQIAPSTNANRGTLAETISLGGLDFVIDDQAQALYGTGLAVGATAWNRWTLNETWDASVSGLFDANFYNNDLINDDVNALLRLDLGATVGRGRVTFGPLFERRWLAGDEYSSRVGFNLAGIVRPRPDRQVYASTTYWSQNYDDRDYQNGNLITANLGMTQILSPSVRLAIGLPLAKEVANTDHLSHLDKGLVVTLEREWKGGVVSEFTASYTNAEYDGNFPSFTMPRSDDVSSIRVGLRSRAINIRGFTPEVSYTFTDSSSNIVFYDYQSHDFALDFSQRF
jgi:tetratricopeptide (TPR) repeat protein